MQTRSPNGTKLYSRPTIVPTQMPGARRIAPAWIAALACLVFSLAGQCGTPTTTTLVVAPNPSVYGQEVTLTATVNPLTAAGTVTFNDGGGFLDTKGIVGGVATLSTSGLTLGDHSLTATYNGDGTYDPSTSTAVSQTVNRANTSVSVASSPNPSVTGQSVTFTATVSAVSPGSGTPGGSVDFYINGELAAAGKTLTGGQATCSRSFGHIESPADVVAYYSGSPDFNPSNDALDPLTQTINKADTITAITTAPGSPVPLGGQFTVGGTVTALAPGSGTPTGTVVVTTTAGDSSAANLSGGAWSCTLISSAVGAGVLTAVYEGNESFAGSTGMATFETSAIGTTVTVFVSDTPLVVGDTATGTVRVQGVGGNYGAPPTGTVTLSHTGNGTLSRTSYTLHESDGGYFEFTYSPSDAAPPSPHVITATYVSDSDIYADGADTFNQEVILRAVDLSLIATPADVYVLQPVTITIHVEDDTTAGTPGDLEDETVTFSASSDTGSHTGWFDSGDPGDDYVLDLNGPGDYDVTYTPGAEEDLSSSDPSAAITITATLTGSTTYPEAAASQKILVSLRPTETTVSFAVHEGIYVDQHTTFTVAVEDVADDRTPETVTPDGTITIYGEETEHGGIRTPDGTGSSTPGFVSQSTTSVLHEWTYSYWWDQLYADGADYDVVHARYDPNDGIHLWSEGRYGIGISRRPTEVTVTCSGENGAKTGFSFTATVAEVADTPDVTDTPEGQLVIVTGFDKDGEYTYDQSGPADTWDFEIITDLPIANPTVTYLPSDYEHIESPGAPTEPCTREIDTGSDNVPNTNCDANCGSGGKDVFSMITSMNNMILGFHILQMGLDAASIVTSLIPDPVWTAGIIFESGTEIPAKEIVAAIFDTFNNVLIEAAITAMETDLDGDGLPGVIEQNVTYTSDQLVDTDADAMGDAEELGYNAGFAGGTLRPDPNNPDSDFDGIMDGYELAPFATDVCIYDMDCDTVPDGVEVACTTSPTSDNGFMTEDYESHTATWPITGYSFTFPFDDLRDHPDPREGDTDGDGLDDSVELGPGIVVLAAMDTPYHPYVNDPDSDGDGILDGMESTDGNAIWNYTRIGNSSTTGIGETHLCCADTDADGLLDGEEEGLFGRGMRTVTGRLGTDTNPALDDDSDDDGLSDYEEHVVAQTDPMNWDSDGDGISDANELMAVGGSWPARVFAQVSDPLDPDTDDDLLPDGVEFTGTGLGDPSSAYWRVTGGDPDTVCSYVDDDDSDDDGLQDGHEDLDKNGRFDLGTIGSTGTIGTGETDLCNPDTDGDGLADGQEEWQLGQGSTPVTSQDGGSITQTVPALDMDSDDDGLSDGEEVNVTHTDPLDWDTDGDTLSDLNELRVTGGAWPLRTFAQVSDPLDPDTDDDGLVDNVEYNGTGSNRFLHLNADGSDDLACPYVNDDDSDNDGLQDGAEDANHDGTWGVLGVHAPIGGISTQAGLNSDGYYETDPCNPDTDGDGLLDGEEASLLGGGPISQRPATGWPSAETKPGFSTVAPQGVSTQAPDGPDYSGGGHPLYTFTPMPGPSMAVTVPALDTDTDNDGLSDDEEVNVTGTNALDADSDNDTIADADELVATSGAWPHRSFDQESDPLDINTDDDYLFDPVEGECGDPTYAGTGLSTTYAGLLGGDRDTECPYVNNADSDNDDVMDGSVIPISRQGPGMTYSYTFFEAFADVEAADIQPPGTVRVVVTPATGEQNDDLLCNVCDPDSDGDGLTDGAEVGLGTNPQDWDTDDDGRNDWHEVTGGGPIPTDPFDPDTDDDGLLDSAEVFGTNPTNPVNADTDGDGLCDGGAGTPYMMSGHPTVTVNPICKSCAVPGNDPCAGPRSGSPDGIGDHPNPMGLGEDENGDGTWDVGVETDPNQFDTDGDADGDGIEKLGFSTSRQSMISATDLFGRAITVVYPACGCMDPLDPDTDDDGISDGMEDLNHDGNFDFAKSDFDFDVMPLLGPPQPDPEETNPCDPDTDHDDLTDYEERNQPNWASVYPFNPTNPLDHDSDNDWLTDGYEVHFTCTVTEFTTLDNDIDGRLDEDPLDGIDNDGDGLVDEDPVDFTIRSVPTLNPTDRDSDSDGLIDGLDSDPCNSDLIPYLFPALGEPVDLDGDGFADIDELLAGTSEFDPDGHPVAFGQVDLDFDGCIDDRVWLEPYLVCCHPVDLARTVVIDLDNNVLADLRVTIVARNVTRGDFDNDGSKDDLRYVLECVLSNYRALQGKILATIDDFNGDLVIDRVVVERK